MVLVPAAMGLLGARAWWLPSWLERLLPSVDVEGPAYEAPETSAEDDEPAPDREEEPALV
jgi:RND superfamily putative drug exporter